MPDQPQTAKPELLGTTRIIYCHACRCKTWHFDGACEWCRHGPTNANSDRWQTQP